MAVICLGQNNQYGGPAINGGLRQRFGQRGRSNLAAFVPAPKHVVLNRMHRGAGNVLVVPTVGFNAEFGRWIAPLAIPEHQKMIDGINSGANHIAILPSIPVLINPAGESVPLQKLVSSARTRTEPSPRYLCC